MARTIKLKESDLTKIVRRISETRLLMEEPKEGDRKVKDGVKAWGKIFNTLGTLFSDSRLKKNIIRVGKSPSGIPIYEFEYKNKVRFGSGTYRGVLAEHTPKKAVVLHENGYKMVDYGMLDVAFEEIKPTKGNTIKLKESDLTNVIKRVINEKLYDDGKGMFPGGGGPGPTFPGNPFDDFDDWGGMNQGGGSNDPMGRGNEEMEIDVETTGPTNPNMGRIAGELEKLDYQAMRTQIQGHRKMGRRNQSELLEVVDKMEQLGSIIGTVPDDDPKVLGLWKWLGGKIGKFRDWLDDLLHDCYCGGSWGPCPC